jgi:hypothetical protein
MTHHTTSHFWDCYAKLPEAVRRLADGNYELLRADPRHSSLHFKRVGRLWSVRVGIGHRALAAEEGNGQIIWFWIGPHAEYNRIIRGAGA